METSGHQPLTSMGRTPEGASLISPPSTLTQALEEWAGSASH